VANCVPCHGESRHGVYGSGGALTPESLAGRSDVAIKETISQGIPYTAMPAFKPALSPEEIDALLQLIKYTSP
jgi:mono/diheme cytochrome c family protein